MFPLMIKRCKALLSCPWLRSNPVRLYFNTPNGDQMWDSKGGGLAQWLGCRISEQGVPVSSTGRSTVFCGLEQVTFTSCLVLVKPRKRWTADRLGQTVTRLETT